jgi:membrane-associated phospholipid phosphatase
MNSIDLSIVKWIQSFRNDFLDTFFLIITEMGDETFFLVLAALLYWTIDKKFAYRFMMFFLFGAVVNGSLKFLTASPRPHVEFPEDVSLVGEGSGGTSLPSGHAQNSSILGLTLQEKAKGKLSFLTPLLVFMVFFVMLSRLYLGEHYLSDVLFGLAISYAMYSFVNKVNKKVIQHPFTPYLSVIIVILLAVLTEDKNVFIASSTILGVMIGYPLEEKHIGFTAQGSLFQSILRLAVGLGVAVALRAVIKIGFEQGLYSLDFENNPTLFDNLLDFIRYFIVTLWMILGAPFLFKKFEKKLFK